MVVTVSPFSDENDGHDLIIYANDLKQKSPVVRVKPYYYRGHTDRHTDGHTHRDGQTTRYFRTQ